MILEVKYLNAWYGRLQALWDVSVSVESGSCIALIGSNGAGKSTFLRSIAGLMKTTKGAINYQDENILGMPVHRVVRKGIVLCPEGRQIFPRLTVLENMSMGGYTIGKDKMQQGYDRAFELFPVLKERAKQAAGTLSGGEQQMLAIARALMSNPKVLMLDEPSLGLSPIMTEKLFELIQEIQKQGVTIILVEQNASMALSISDYGYVIQNGHIVISGDSNTLMNSDEVAYKYLGG